MKLETLTSRYFTAYEARETATTWKQETAAQTRMDKAFDTALEHGLEDEFLFAVGISTTPPPAEEADAMTWTAL